MASTLIIPMRLNRGPAGCNHNLVWNTMLGRSTDRLDYLDCRDDCMALGIMDEIRHIMTELP